MALVFLQAQNSVDILYSDGERVKGGLILQTHRNGTADKPQLTLLSAVVQTLDEM